MIVQVIDFVALVIMNLEMVEEEEVGEVEEGSIVIIDVIDVLRRLSIRGDIHSIGRVLEYLETDAKKFTAMYYAVIRSNAPIRHAIRCFESLSGSQEAANCLLNIALETDFRDVLLQVGLASQFLSSGHDTARLFKFLIEKLGLLATNTASSKNIDEVKAVIKHSSIDPALLSEVKVGTVVLLACSNANVMDSFIELFSEWLADNAAKLEPKSLGLACLGLLISKCRIEAVKMHLIPVFNRLLLRNSVLALTLLDGMQEVYPLPEFISLLGDSGLWSLTTAENDEHRTLALQAVAKTNCLERFAEKVFMLYSGKSFKVKKSLLMVAFRSKDAMPLECLMSIFEKESNEELLYWIASSLVFHDYNFILQSALKGNKSSVKSLLFAALSLCKVGELQTLLSVTGITPMDQLLIVLATANTCSVSKDLMTNGLKAGGWLSDKVIGEAIEKFPSDPIVQVGIFI